MKWRYSRYFVKGYFQATGELSGLKVRIVEGVTVPRALCNCRRAFLYQEAGEWILSTQRIKIAVFETEEDAERWWNKFGEVRALQLPPLSRSKPGGRRARRAREGRLGRVRVSEIGRWSTDKGLCPVCGGDGGATGHCYKCGGCGWA